MKSKFLSLLFLLTFSFSANSQITNNSSKSPQTVAFVNVNVLPMDSERILKDQTVIVSNGIISEIGASALVNIPVNALKIDGRGKYLMPGLVDMHTHLLSPIELRLYVAEGVTSVFNLNGRPAHLLWREKTTEGKMLGPAIYTVGPKFDRPRTADEAVKTVDEQALAGYDGIKIYNQVSKAEYPALIAEARKHNLIIVGHVAREPGFEETLKAGQAIAHAEEFIYTFFNQTNDEDRIKLDESLIPQAVELTRKSGIWITPTLVTYDSIISQVENLTDFLANPELRYISPYQREKFSPANNVYLKGFRQDQISKLKEISAFQKKLIRALHKANVPILIGTDSSDVGPIAGFSVHRELQNLVDCGFTPFEALQAATRDSAKILKGVDEFGTISLGKRADLILLDADPLENIANSEKIKGVMVRGQWLSESKISQIKSSIPAAYSDEEKILFRDLRKNPRKVTVYLKENDPFDQLASGVLARLVLEQKISALNKLVQNVRRFDSDSILTQENTINNLGYQLLGKTKIKEAVEVFALNTKLHPRSANTFDSLAEAQALAGDTESAIQNYQKALLIEPGYPNAETAAKFIKDHKSSK